MPHIYVLLCMKLPTVILNHTNYFFNEKLKNQPFYYEKQVFYEVLFSSNFIQIFNTYFYVIKNPSLLRHCEKRSDEAIHTHLTR